MTLIVTAPEPLVLVVVRLLTEKTNDVIYTIDLDFNNIYISPSVERILGFTPGEYLGRSPDQRIADGWCRPR